MQVVPKLLPWAADASADSAYEISNILLEIAAAAVVAPGLASTMAQVNIIPHNCKQWLLLESA